jgi:hypothetical protein
MSLRLCGLCPIALLTSFSFVVGSPSAAKPHPIDRPSQSLVGCVHKTPGPVTLRQAPGFDLSAFQALGKGSLGDAVQCRTRTHRGCGLRDIGQVVAVDIDGLALHGDEFFDDFVFVGG